MKEMFRSLMIVVIALCVVLIIAITFGFTRYASADADKVYVCKYVGSGSDLRLQTGQNPIVVSISAIKDYQGVGSWFNDEQGPSYVLATYPQDPEPTKDNCPLAVTPTDTPVPMDTPTATSTLTPLPTDTPTMTPTNTPTTDPPTATPTSTGTQPTFTPTLPSTPTNTPITPTNTSTAVPTPTETPRPPQPDTADENIKVYPADKMGVLIMDGYAYQLYYGANATDGTLMLPDWEKGAAWYMDVIWVHRLWRTGPINLYVGSPIAFYDMDNKRTDYVVESISFIDYGVYPKVNLFKDEFQYLATCYSNDKGEWIGVQLYKLIPID